MIPRNPDGTLAVPSGVIGDAHDAGLFVHGWTFRRENRFLPVEYRQGSDPNAPGDVMGEMAGYVAAGMDGFFTDNPDLGAIVTELNHDPVLVGLDATPVPD